MILDTIKALLNADLIKSIEDALKGKGKDGKDIDLVIGNDGSGSSPHSRGLLHLAQLCAADVGIIPAFAGITA